MNVLVHHHTKQETAIQMDNTIDQNDAQEQLWVLLADVTDLPSNKPLYITGWVVGKDRDSAKSKFLHNFVKRNEGISQENLVITHTKSIPISIPFKDDVVFWKGDHYHCQPSQEGSDDSNTPVIIPSDYVLVVGTTVVSKPNDKEHKSPDIEFYCVLYPSIAVDENTWIHDTEYLSGAISRWVVKLLRDNASLRFPVEDGWKHRCVASIIHAPVMEDDIASIQKTWEHMLIVVPPNTYGSLGDNKTARISLRS